MKVTVNLLLRLPEDVHAGLTAMVHENNIKPSREVRTSLNAEIVDAVLKKVMRSRVGKQAVEQFRREAAQLKKDADNPW